jgi:hypothetical protein
VVQHFRQSRRVVAAVVALVGLVMLALPATATASTRSAPGVSKDEIKVGFIYFKSAGAAGESVGVTTRPLDSKTAYQALVDDYNKDPALGRKIVPVYFGYDVLSGQQSVQEQAACTLFTQDQPVFAAMISQLHSQTLLDCLRKAGVVTIAAPGYSFDDNVVYAKNPQLAAAGTFVLNRAAQVIVAGLSKAKFFGTSPKLGVIYSEDPAYTRVVKGTLTQALAKQKIKVAEYAPMPPLATAADLAAVQARLQSAVLRFVSAGIDHVMFLSTSGSTSLLFMNMAKAQNYSPAYGLSTYDEPAGIAPLAPADQMANAVGVGWWPTNEVPNPTFDKLAQGCIDTITAAGETMSDSRSYRTAVGDCDQLNVFRLALTAAGTPTMAAFMKGLATMSNVDSASLLGDAAKYSATRRDGAFQAQTFTFDPATKSFAYTGKPFTPATT